MWPMADALLGDARGGVLIGAGSLDLAECTLCSSRCICAVRLRIWVREVELGSPRVAGAFALALRIRAGVAFLPRDAAVLRTGTDGPCEDLKFALEGTRDGLGLGVILFLLERTLRLLGGFDGVLRMLRLNGADASDIGGEGGVGVSETVSAVETDFVSGGVVIIGEDAVELGEPP